MPRELGVEYSGAIYHVMNRGDQREDIFRDDEDRTRFLATLSDPGKVAIARQLRRETTMSLKWVANNLTMGKLDDRGKPCERERDHQLSLKSED